MDESHCLLDPRVKSIKVSKDGKSLIVEKYTEGGVITEIRPITAGPPKITAEPSLIKITGRLKDDE